MLALACISDEKTFYGGEMSADYSSYSYGLPARKNDVPHFRRPDYRINNYRINNTGSDKSSDASGYQSLTCSDSSKTRTALQLPEDRHFPDVEAIDRQLLEGF